MFNDNIYCHFTASFAAVRSPFLLHLRLIGLFYFIACFGMSCVDMFVVLCIYRVLLLLLYVLRLMY